MGLETLMDRIRDEQLLITQMEQGGKAYRARSPNTERYYQ
jgi:hypothetical protein